MRATLATMMIAFLALAGANTAHAQAAKTAKVIIIDGAEITRSSLAGKDLMRQTENFSAEMEAEQARLQQDVRNTEAELIRQRAIINEDALEEKMRIEQQRLAIAERDLRDKANRIQIAVRRATSDLQSALQPIYQELMVQHGANLVLERSQLILTGSGMDVTRQVIEKLDLALPSLKIVVPDAAPGASAP